MTLILSGTDSSVSAPAVQGGTGGTTTGLYYPATNQLALATNGTQALLVDSSQNVGIGVTPSAWATLLPLQVKNGYVAGYLNRVYVGANNYYDGSNSKYIATDYATRYYQYAGQHIWENAASGTAGAAITFTTAMTLDASGNLGIGTASPTQKLQVAGNAFISAGQYFMWDNAGAWALQSDASTYVRTYIAGNEKMRVNAYGIGVGGAIPSSGTGITFPATQSASSDANTLDDYEEGGFTPSIYAGGANFVTSYNGDRYGTYTKIGNTVFFEIRIANITTNSATGSITVVGLPFTTTGSYYYPIYNWPYSGISSTGTIILRTNLSSTALQIQTTNTAGSGADITNSNISGASLNWMIAGFYSI